MKNSCMFGNKLAVMVLFAFLYGCGPCSFQHRIVNYSQDELSVVINNESLPNDRLLVVRPESEIVGRFAAGSRFKLSTSNRRSCYSTDDYDHLFSWKHQLQIDWHSARDSVVISNFHIKSDSCK